MQNAHGTPVISADPADDVRCDEVSRTDKTHGSINFTAKDRFGRIIGTNWNCATVTFAPAPAGARSSSSLVKRPGTYFSLWTSALRDGSSYGATQRERMFTTEAERDVAVRKYIADARKHAEAKTQGR